MNTGRRLLQGVLSRCWCGKGIVIFYSKQMRILIDGSIDVRQGHRFAASFVLFMASFFSKTDGYGFCFSICFETDDHSFDLLAIHSFETLLFVYGFIRPYFLFVSVQQKKENHLFKWVDEALLDEIRRVEAEQGRIAEQIEDLKQSLTKAVEEEVRKQKNSLEIGCLGSILWLSEN